MLTELRWTRPISRAGTCTSTLEGYGDVQHARLLALLEKWHWNLLSTSHGTTPQVVKAELCLATQNRIPNDMVNKDLELQCPTTASSVTSAKKPLVPAWEKVAIFAHLRPSDDLLATIFVATNQLNKNVLRWFEAVEDAD